MPTNIAPFQEGLFSDSCAIIEQSRASAYRSVNEILVQRNWLLGMRIQQEVLKEQRAKYGVQVVTKLSKALTDKYGKGFTKTNLYHFVSFYQTWPDIFHTACGKCENAINGVRPEGHNPTIGILLCADTDEDVAHYSVLNGSDQLYAAKFLTYMPTQEELRREIEQQKEFFKMKNEK